jgi:hypothetical protein
MGGEPVALDTPLTEGAQLRRDLGRRLTVADLLPLVQAQLDGDESDELLVTVDGKFADLATAIVPGSVIEVLTEDPGAPEPEGASALGRDGLGG